jgi:excisionase family DNA binding protein
MNALLEKPDTVVPTDADAKLATESSRILAKLRPDGEFRVRLESGDVLTLPSSAVRLLSHLLTEMSRGNAVTLIPVHAELTTQEAADYLNVSRPYLIRLLEEGKIEFRMVGTHRRVRFEHLHKYREELHRNRDRALDELTAQAQEFNMGY